jgi:predicted RNase H-like nuclease (RuvC/YqgF family)
MNLIFTQKQAREKIEGLQSRIDELESDALAKEEGLEAIQTELATARDDLAAKQSKIEELEEQASKVETLEAKVQEAETKITEAENSAAKKAVEIVAEAGLDKPIEAASSQGPKTLALTEFRELTPIQKTQFFRNGGKLTD